MSDLELFWGDLHNHNEVGYGKGALARSYLLATNALDFFAFTAHGWWPDIPTDDADMRRQHLEGFQRAQDRWPEVLAAAEAANHDGRFVAFVGFEWHSLGWGDCHVLFPGSQGEIIRADNLGALLDRACRAGALVIPHHPAYRLGWRGVNWDEYDDKLCPVVEIFSEHGNSFETPSPHGMYGHSMGGASLTQTVLEQLKGGRVLGVVASTDSHFGHPGCYGQGLTGVWAATLTRDGILDALRRRHTYAVTGDRIRLAFTLGDNMMGDVLPPDTPRDFDIHVDAMDEIDTVALCKNGEVLRCWHSGNVTDEGRRRVLHIEWGWDRVGSRQETTWNIRGSVENGHI